MSNALVLYLLMLPNLCLLFYTRIIAGSHLWSIGVEEQFYLFWPLMTKAFYKRPLVLLLAFFLVTVTVGSIARAVGCFACETLPPQSQLQALNIYTVCRCITDVMKTCRMMLFGATAAVLFLHGTARICKFLYHSVARILIVAGIAFYIAVPYSHCDVPLGVLFALLVISLTDDRIKLLAWHPLVYLGTISYGIYMYHAIVLQCYMKWGESLDPNCFNFLLYATALPVVLLISALSYRYFEQPFLRLKDRFTTIKSGRI